MDQYGSIIIIIIFVTILITSFIYYKKYTKKKSDIQTLWMSFRYSGSEKGSVIITYVRTESNYDIYNISGKNIYQDYLMTLKVNMKTLECTLPLSSSGGYIGVANIKNSLAVSVNPNMNGINLIR